MLEVLEDRTVLSPFWYVNATTDTGAGNLTTQTGDLRFCVNNAKSGDDVFFNLPAGQTITLTSQLSVAQQTLSIIGQDGNGNNLNITIDGQHSTRLFEILGATTINNLTLTGGNGNGGSGGAIVADSGSSLSVNYDTFVNNSATGNGGAIEAVGGVGGSGDNFTSNTASGNGGAIDNRGNTGIGGSTFSGNRAGAAGGAIENTYQLTVSAANVGGFTPCTFTGNSAVTTGGAIDSSGGGQGQVNAFNSNFYGNTAANGGAIASNDPTILSASIFGSQSQPNSATASGGNGGAVYAVLAPNAFSEPLSATNCTFAYNQAAGTGSGGAIYTTMTTDVEGGTFDSNSVPNGGGGGIEADAVPGPMRQTLTVNNATIKNQTATGGDGGAINTSEVATLNNNTFTNNKAVAAGGKGGNGGAVSSHSGPQGQLLDTGSQYSNNTAQGGDGGAIQTQNYATLTNDQFTSNKARNGGAIKNDDFLTVSGGNFTSNTATGAGGAIENTNSLKVTDSPTSVPCSFSKNTAGTTGGAIDSSGNGKGSLSVYNSQFGSNQAPNGGAIRTNDITLLSGSTFGGQGNGNTATGTFNLGGGDGDGGAVEADPSSDPTSPSQLTVGFCTFASNQVADGQFRHSGRGGAIFTFTTTDVHNSTFTANNAPRQGGAIDYNVSNPTNGLSSLYINLDTFTGNGSQEGGAVASQMTSTTANLRVYTTVTNSTFNGNKATGNGKGVGGGLSIYQATNGAGTATSATLTNDTFFQNTSDGHGGGLALEFNEGAMGAPRCSSALTSLTVNANTAAIDSGGLYIVNNTGESVASVTNCILDGNQVLAAGYKGPVDVTTPSMGTLWTDNGYNLFATSDATYFLPDNNNQINDNPRLANALAANGAPAGYPLTLALLNTSPGYEKGNPSLARTIDERGFTRQTGKVSIGAEDPDASAGP